MPHDIKIVMPVSNRIRMSVGIENCADEFYLGILPDELRSNRWNLVNRRHDEHSNLRNIETVVENIQTAHAYSRKVHLTLNSHFYPERLYEYFMEMLSKILKHAAPDSVIVSDLNLMLLLGENFPDLPLTASAICHVFNSRSAAFYMSLGAKRIILPRHISVEEAAIIASRNPGVELECMCMFGECANIEGLCGNIGSFGWPCSCLVLEPLAEQGREEAAMRYDAYCRRKMDSCGACGLPALARAGVRHFEIVGREEPEEKIIRGLVFLNRLRELGADIFRSESAYQNEAVKLYREIFKKDCGGGNCCNFERNKEDLK